jgi:hypothetical protein
VKILISLQKNWKFLRLYDCSVHAETVLEVIHDEGLDFKLMLGMDLAAEMGNPHCPWGVEYSEVILSANRQANSKQAEKLIALANRYPVQMDAVSSPGMLPRRCGRFTTSSCSTGPRRRRFLPLSSRLLTNHGKALPILLTRRSTGGCSL